MALEPGSKFGSYEIAEPIGSGGMGEVFRATDTNLKRDVAIKVLPASFADDGDRLARFQREAEVLAALNHPNIAQIYGLEKSKGTTALVMELIEGPTLADRIEQGPIAAEDALTIAMQIIDALDAAHERGIVHRDLKPANVKLRPDGTVKVLDFGIAKALDTQTGISGPQQPQLTTPAMTQAGLVLGTAAYMSPEQARGKPVDQRADVWAFGCVLYEMLTGQPAFGGEDVPITLARVLAYDANMDTVPDSISSSVRQTIDLCLRKDPKKRLHSMGDVRLMLEGEIAIEPAEDEAVADASEPSLRQKLPLAVAAALTAIALTAATAWILSPVEPTRAVNRFDYNVPGEQLLRNTGRNVIAVSPDGRHFAYNTATGIYLRAMGELEARLIPGTEPDLTSPVFSPDGQSIAYWDRGTTQLRRIAISGGAPVVIAEIPENPRGISWSEDGTILVGQDNVILRVADVGGTPEVIVEAREGEILYGPRLLNGGGAVLYSATAGANWDTGQIIAESLTTGERAVLVPGGNDARYVPTGHLVYALEDDLFAVSFDVENLTVSGGPVPLVQSVSRAGNNQTGVANYDFAGDGTLVFVPGSASGALSLVWVDRDGREDVVANLSGDYLYPRISPDGNAVVLDGRSQGNDVWIWDFVSETRTRLITDGGGQYPIWTPDGERIVYGDSAGGISWRAANNTGSPRSILDAASLLGNGGVHPYFVTPDGEAVVFRDQETPENGDNIGMVAVDGDAEPEWLLAGPWHERNASLSPNNRWVAYQSYEAVGSEVFVRPFPNIDDDQVQISNTGGFKPVWSRDGRELFYLNPSDTGPVLMAVEVDAESESFSFGERRKLIDWPYFVGGQGTDYDVSPDGQRFLALAGDTASGNSNSVIIVQNWFEDLRRLAPAD